MESLLISPWVMVVVIAMAIYVQAAQSRYEHAFARIPLLVLYVALIAIPAIPIETARFYSRVFVVTILVTEIASYYFRRRK